MIYDGAALIEEIQSIGGLPDGEVEGYKDADLLKHAAAVLRSRIVPIMVAHRLDFYTQKARIAISSSSDEYRIPVRALGDSLRAIWYVDSNGTKKKLDPVMPSELHLVQNPADQPRGYYLNATHIVIVGNPGSGYLEVWFPFRVGDIVLAAEARQVASFDAVLKTITAATAFPSGFVAGAKVDIHTQYGGHDIRIFGATITNRDGPGTTLTLQEAIDGSGFGTYAVEATDWVCLERQSALVALTEELIPALARAVAQRVSEAEGDADGRTYHAEELEKDQKAATPLIGQERVQTKPRRFFGRRSPFLGG